MLRTEIIQLHYKIPVVRHREKQKMMELMAGSDKRYKEIYREL